MSEGLIGRFHHLGESRTCHKCGCALGSRDHEEACEPWPYGPVVADFVVALPKRNDENLVLQVLKSRE